MENNMNKKSIYLIIAAALAIILCFSLCSCGSAEEENTLEKEKIFQAGLLQSLTLGEYDGFMPVSELKEYGDTGIGTFDRINGEMIMLDGTVYQALWDGSIIEADDDVTVPFANVTFFDDDVSVGDINAADIEALRSSLDELIKGGLNQFYMAKIECTCPSVKVRSEVPQEKPYEPLAEVMKTAQREYSYENTNGTVIALYCPDYMDGLNTPGWHFHYISEDKKTGGHVLEIAVENGSLTMDLTSGFEMQLPDTESFNNKDLAQDVSTQIKAVEQGGGER